MLKTMKQLVVAILMGFTYWNIVLAQYPDYKKHQYHWANQQPLIIEVDEQFLHEDAIILNEENSIKVFGVKSEFITVNFQKRLRIKYLTQTGIDNYSTFTLPESFDPLYDFRYASLLNKQNSFYGPKYFDTKVIWFAARVIKKNGSVVDAIIKDQILKDTVIYNKKFYRSFFYQFSIKELEPGDELEVHYNTEIPYDPNWFRFNSNRIFFHGSIPKQKYTITLECPKKLEYSLLNCKADSTFETDKRIIHYWQKKNLPGCMSEPGAKPHLKLPHIVYNIHEDDYRYYTKHMSGELIPIPFWNYILRIREAKAAWLKRVAEKMIRDKQNTMVNKFISETSQGVTDTVSFIRARKVHHAIAETFKYHNDHAFFAEIDIGLERMGSYTEKKTLREISRYNLYAKILNRLNTHYYTAYLMDKRIATLSKGYISPLIDNDFAFVILSNDKKPVYLYPKRSRYGYEVDELPFYWENTPVMLVSIFKLWADYKVDLNFIQTPPSNEQNNFRTSSVLATISLNPAVINFEATVTLSGQFSTITREYYQYGYKDPTINPLYYTRICDIGGNPKLINSEITSHQSVYPFKTNLKVKYTCEDLLKKNRIAFIL